MRKSWIKEFRIHTVSALFLLRFFTGSSSPNRLGFTKELNSFDFMFGFQIISNEIQKLKDKALWIQELTVLQSKDVIPIASISQEG